MRTPVVLVLGLVLLFGSMVAAQSDVTVGEITAPKIQWGPQTLSVYVSNKSENPKYLSAMATLAFTGLYLNPDRTYRSNFIVEPSNGGNMLIKFDIPMNFGQCHMSIGIYDVVDTLDQILPDQRIIEQQYDLTFRVPDSIMPYTQERIIMPPLTENSPLLDAEFDRIALWMFHEGRTKQEIASMIRMDTAAFYKIVSQWKYYGFMAVARVDSSLRPAFPMIPVAEAEAIKPVAEQTALQLASIIDKNLKQAYPKVLDSLIKAGVLSKDSSDFLNGGTVLYRTYPTVGALLLWYEMGRGFVTGPNILNIMAQTDPCNTLFPAFMYAVQGGDVFNGHHYFDMSFEGEKPAMSFADHIPKVRCPEIYPYLDRVAPGGGELGWGWAADEGYPEIFAFDTAVVHPALRTLGNGAQSVLDSAYESFHSIVEKAEPHSDTEGSRFWFWNLVASRTLDKLLAMGSVTRRGNGHFRMESL